jgi:hypothetical protein
VWWVGLYLRALGAPPVTLRWADCMSREARPPYVTREIVLDFVEYILGGLKTPEQRIEWLRTFTPKAFAMMVESRSWTASGATLQPNGSGSLSRPAVAASDYTPPPRKPHRPYRYPPRECCDCGESYVPTQGRQKRCSDCRAALEGPRVREAGNYGRGLCPICGISFRRRSGLHVYCGAACRRVGGREHARRWWREVGSARQRERDATKRAAHEPGGGKVAVSEAELGMRRLSPRPSRSPDPDVSAPLPVYADAPRALAAASR